MLSKLINSILYISGYIGGIILALSFIHPDNKIEQKVTTAIEKESRTFNQYILKVPAK